MEGNPFATVVRAIRNDSKSQIPTSYRLGTVSSVLPLMVDVAGTVQDRDSLIRNSMLVSFEVGDRLLLFPIEDEQKYIIMCKVVDV